MRTMQAKITDTIRAAVEDVRHLELVQAASAANDGTLYVMGGLATVMTIRYSFQPGYCTVRLAGPAIDRADLPPRNGPVRPLFLTSSKEPAPHRTADFHHLAYEEGDRLATLLVIIRDALAPFDPTGPVVGSGPEVDGV
jgi:hypothetical protein